jgi:hypothetical protein
MIFRVWKWTVAPAFLVIGLCGCSGMETFFNPPPPQTAANGPPPRVQNCGIVSIGSPTNYACNGKVYTSFDLAKLRQDWDKTHGG